MQNDVNIFIMKYKCLEVAMEEIKTRGYANHQGEEGGESSNPLSPSVILRTILTFPANF